MKKSTSRNSSLNSVNNCNYEKNNVKSNVLYSIPCVKSCAHAFCSSKPISILATLFVGLVSCLLLSGLSHGSCYAASTSLTIDGGSSKSITETIAPNETKYVSSNVTYSANDVQDYTIKISYANGSDGLKYDGGSGNSSDGGSSSNITINGVVDNTIGSNISNAWGYSWADGNTAEANYPTLPYNSIPTTGTKNVETGTTISSTTKKMIFAANLSDSNPTGHYKANVLLSLVATPKATTYTLTLNNNGGNGGTTTKTCSTYTNACDISLSDVVIPTKDGYTFLGWADSNTATSAAYTTASTITMTADKTIWAVWKQNEPSVTGFGSIKKMQDMTTSICNSVSNGTSGQLYDTRDESVYTVRKLSDGKCWMTQNLRLTGNKTLTSADSDVSGNYALPEATPLSGFGSANNTSYVYYDSANANNGAYYNWYTATAGTGTSSTTQGEVSSSICPKGWKLPSTNDYYLLASKIGAGNNAAGSTLLRNDTYNFRYGGVIYNNTINNSGSAGTYLTRAAALSLRRYSAVGLYLNDTTVNSFYDTEKTYGTSLRCVAYSATGNYSYSVSYNRGSSTNIGASFTVTSSDNTYTFKVNSMIDTCCSSKGQWTGSDGRTYSNGDYVTLTSGSPKFTLTATETGSICVC